MRSTHEVEWRAFGIALLCLALAAPHVRASEFALLSDEVETTSSEQPSGELHAPDQDGQAEAMPADCPCHRRCDNDLTKWVFPRGWRFDCCSPCPHDPFLFAGTEFTFLRADAHTGGVASLTLDDIGTGGIDLTVREQVGTDAFAIAPRFWLGAQLNEKWAIQARYWQLRGADSDRARILPGTVPLVNFTTNELKSDLDAYTVDLEVVRSFEPFGFKVDSFVGARHASFSDEAKLSSTGVFTPGSSVDFALSNGSSFDGVGVTYGLVARHPLYGPHTWLFASVRGSNLSGDSDTFARAAGSLSVPPNAPFNGAATLRRNNESSNLSIGEFQIGVQYERPLDCMPAHYFARVAYELQEWELDGQGLGTAAIGGAVGNVQANGSASGGLGGMTLHGVSVATGFTW